MTPSSVGWSVSPDRAGTPVGYYDTGAIRSRMNPEGLTKVEIDVSHIEPVRPAAQAGQILR
jgi:hypothetical protein